MKAPLLGAGNNPMQKAMSLKGDKTGSSKEEGGKHITGDYDYKTKTFSKLPYTAKRDGWC